MDNGAVEVWAIATHGVLSDPAIERIAACNSLKVIIVVVVVVVLFCLLICIQRKGVVITNTIPHDKARVAKAGKIVTLDISTLLGEAIRRTHNGESISALFGASFATESTIV
jgi:ribose-phosphate pyrophosphokinase